MGHFPGLNPVFGQSGQSPSISTLNFKSWSTKLGGTIRATKKMTHIDNGHPLLCGYFSAKLKNKNHLPTNITLLG